MSRGLESPELTGDLLSQTGQEELVTNFQEDEQIKQLLKEQEIIDNEAEGEFDDGADDSDTQNDHKEGTDEELDFEKILNEDDTPKNQTAQSTAEIHEEGEQTEESDNTMGQNRADPSEIREIRHKKDDDEIEEKEVPVQDEGTDDEA